MKTSSTLHKIYLPVTLATLLIVLAVLQIMWIRGMSDGLESRMQSNLKIGSERFRDELNDRFTGLRNAFEQTPYMQTNLPPELVLNNVWESVESDSMLQNMIKEVYWMPAVPENGDSIVYVIRKSNLDAEAQHVSDISVINDLHDLNIDFDWNSTINRNADLLFSDPPIIHIHFPKRDSTLARNSNPDRGSTVNPANVTIQFRYEATIVRPDTASHVSILDALLRSQIPRAFSEASVYLILNKEAITDNVLPELADRHFGENGTLDYHYAIAKKGNPTQFFAGDVRDTTIVSEAEIAVPIRTNTRTMANFGRPAPVDPETIPRNLFVTGETHRIDTMSVSDIRSININAVSAPSLPRSPIITVVGFASPSEWSLFVQHKQGSIEKAASRFRRNTSMLSLGIMSILGIGLVLIMRNNRKADRLAKQQMEFVAGVSHEFRTPLAVIRSAADNLSDGIISNQESAQSYGKLIQNESHRLGNLIEQMMEFAGIQSGQRKYDFIPLQLPQVCIQSLTSLGPEYDPASTSVSISVNNPVSEVMADLPSMLSLFQNLIGNAIKYRNGNADIQIQFEMIQHQGKQALSILFTDNGEGISKEDLPHIFSPFYRGKFAQESQIKGNGLGLSIVADILKQHGASINVQSELKQGTTFFITMPWLAKPSS